MGMVKGPGGPMDQGAWGGREHLMQSSIWRIFMLSRLFAAAERLVNE